jgi:hypothetical protein
MIGFCESLKPGTVITEGYVERMKEHYVPNLEKAIKEARQHPETSGVRCPFCFDDGFDLSGLKRHLSGRGCEPFNETESRRRIFG